MSLAGECPVNRGRVLRGKCGVSPLNPFSRQHWGAPCRLLRLEGGRRRGRARVNLPALPSLLAPPRRARGGKREKVRAVVGGGVGGWGGKKKKRKRRKRKRAKRRSALGLWAAPASREAAAPSHSQHVPVVSDCRGARAPLLPGLRPRFPAASAPAARHRSPGTAPCPEPGVLPGPLHTGSLPRGFPVPAPPGPFRRVSRGRLTGKGQLWRGGCAWGRDKGPRGAPCPSVPIPGATLPPTLALRRAPRRGLPPAPPGRGTPELAL